jgi:hypothetical protein
MSLAANSYGSVVEVAALAPRYTAAGTFSASTRPTLAQVEKWIDNASATLNVMLAGAGFAVPITDADAAAACGQIVVEVVTDLCHAANSAGRFYTERALERGVSPMKVLRQDMADWVENNAAGLENLGATRTTSLLGGLLYRDTDNSGNPTSPIFQREGFGNVFEDFDR